MHVHFRINKRVRTMEKKKKKSNYYYYFFLKKGKT